jgi:hypothetical protein
MPKTAASPSTSLHPVTPSLALSTPTRKDLESLSYPALFALEDTAGEIQQACKEINDGRLRQWIEAEGKTQIAAAALVGVSQPRISQRCKALGIVSKNARSGRPKTSTAGLISADKSEPEVIDAEVVGEQDVDQGPRVRCATCRNLVPAGDVGAYRGEYAPATDCPTCGWPLEKSLLKASPYIADTTRKQQLAKKERNHLRSMIALMCEDSTTTIKNLIPEIPKAMAVTNKGELRSMIAKVDCVLTESRTLRAELQDWLDHGPSDRDLYKSEEKSESAKAPAKKKTKAKPKPTPRTLTDITGDIKILGNSAQLNREHVQAEVKG